MQILTNPFQSNEILIYIKNHRKQRGCQIKFWHCINVFENVTFGSTVLK